MNALLKSFSPQKEVAISKLKIALLSEIEYWFNYFGTEVAGSYKASCRFFGNCYLPHMVLYVNFHRDPDKNRWLL